MDPFDPARFVKQNTCLPCCSTGPVGCRCMLTTPIINTGFLLVSNYVDYDDAIAGLADTSVSCLIYDASHVVPDYDTYTASIYPLTVSASSAGNVYDGVTFYASVSVKAGSILTLNYSVDNLGDAPDPTCAATISVYRCGGAGGEFVGQDDTGDVFSGSISGTLTVPIIEEGEYWIFITATAGFDEGPETTFGISATMVITSDDTIVVNPVEAQYADGLGEHFVEACPKLLIPPLTEATGDWYASCSDAHDDISDNTSNCVGYTDYNPRTSFTATDGGSSLSFSQSTVAPPPAFGLIWGSVNAESGKTLIISSSGFPDADVNIYNDAGVLVENLSGATPLASSSLPYTGRYTVSISLTGAPVTSSIATITSSGTMTVNPIQALYDVGLTCPARLNCGDSCP